MKRRFFKSVSLLMVLLVFRLPLSSLAQNAIAGARAVPIEIAAARAAAERDAVKQVRAGGRTLWFLGGFCLGPVFVIAAFFSKAAPNPVALAGKSPAYVAAYVDTYEEKVRNRKLIASGTGCGAGGLIAAGVYLLLGGSGYYYYY